MKRLASPERHKNKPDDSTPDSSGIIPSFTGAEFQLKIATLLLCKGLNNNYKFEIHSEKNDVGKFDDITFKFSNESGENNIIIIQAKHTILNDNDIGINELLVDDNSDFAISKYYKSFQEAKKSFKKNNIKIKHAIVYTNKIFELNKLIPKKIDEEKTLESIGNMTEDVTNESKQLTELLKTNENGKLYRFKKNILRPVLKKKLKNFEYKDIAKKLIDCLERRQFFLKIEILRKYQAVLADYVIDFETGLVKESFVDGQTNDSAELKLFRDIFKSTLETKKIPFRNIHSNKAMKCKISLTSGQHSKKKKIQYQIQPWPAIAPILDKDIDEFLDHFIIATNQPKQKDLGGYIEKELGHLPYLKIMEEIRKWVKDEENKIAKSCEKFITTESARSYFTKVDREENQNNFIKPIAQFEEKTKDIIFDDDSMKKMLENFLESEAKLLHVLSGCETLTSIKISKNLIEKNYTNIIFFRLSLLTNSSGCTYSLKSYETKLTNHTLLLFECDSNSENEQIKGKIFEILKRSSSKKIIIVTQQKNLFILKFKEDFLLEFGNFNEYSDNKNSIRSLKIESQKKICENKVKFQNNYVKLGKICSESSLLYEDEQFLLKLINDNLGNIGKVYTDEFDKNIYMDRKFYFKVQFDNKIFIILIDEMDLYTPFSINCAGCIQNPYFVEIKNMESLIFNQIQEKNRDKEIYLLRKEKKYLLILKKPTNCSIESKELIEIINNALRNKIILLDAPPGMGKSTTFGHLTDEIKKKNPTHWVFKIDLSKLSDVLSNIQKSKKSESDALDLFLTEALKLDDEIEWKLFKDYQKTGNIVLLVDAFDEISPDYKEEVIKLIQTLQKESETIRVFISTRPYNDVLEDISKKLNVLRCELQPIVDIDQREYLKKIWSKNELNKDLFETFIYYLFREFDTIIQYDKNQFLGIPLHIYMIATIFEPSFNNFCSSGSKELSDKVIQEIENTLRPSVLYQKFVEIKHQEILDQEKMELKSANVLILEKKKEAYETFEKKIRLLALDNIFDDVILTTILENYDLKKIKIYKSEIGPIKRNGILVSIENNKPQFIHKTFSEYFSAVHIVKELKLNEEKVMDFFLNDILNEKYEMLCKFIDDFLNSDKNITWQKEKIKNMDGKTLFFAIKNTLFNIAKILIENGIDICFIENTTQYSVLHLQFYQNDHLLEMLLNPDKNELVKIKNLLKQKDISKCTPLLMAFENRNNNKLKILVETLNKYFLYEEEFFSENKDGEGILHFACRDRYENHFMTILTWLEKTPKLLKNELLKKNKYYQTPVLVASQYANEKHFKILVETLKNHNLFEVQVFGESKNCDNILHHACRNRNGNEKILITVLTELEKKPELLKEMLKKKGENDKTPLLVASQSKNEKNFEILVKTLKDHDLFDVEVFAVSKNYDRILHYACRNENAKLLTAVLIELEKKPKLLKEMLKKKGDFNKTPLLDAYENWNAIIFKILVETLNTYFVYEEEFSSENKNGENILHYMCRRGNENHFTTILTWLEKTPELLKTMLIKKNQNNESPLLVASQHVNEKKFEILVKTLKTHKLFEVEVFAVSKNGESILHYACNNKNVNILTAILTELKKYPELLKDMLKKKDKNEKTPLLMAPQFETEKNFNILMETLKTRGLFDMELFTEDKNGDNILHYTCRNEHENILMAVLTELKKSPELLKGMLQKKGENDKTPLLVASENWNHNILVILVKTLKDHDLFDVELFTEDKNGENILHYTCRKGNENHFVVVMAELKKTPERLIRMLKKKGENDITPLLAASEIYCYDKTFKIFVKILKDYDLFDVELFAEDKNGDNILHYTCRNEHENILMAVLTELKKTPERLKKMLKKKGKNDKTPMLLASEHDFNETIFIILVEILKEYNLLDVELFAEDENGNDILHNTCRTGNEKNFTAILTELNITPDKLKKMLMKKGENDKTPLLLASENMDEDAFELLEKKLKDHDLFDVELFAEDKNGDNILHYACRNRNEDVFTAILTELNNTPEKLKEMLKKKGENDKTPLLVASENSNENIFKILVKILKDRDLFDVEVSAEDKNGDSILQYANRNENDKILTAVLIELEKKPVLLKKMLQKEGKSEQSPMLDF